MRYASAVGWFIFLGILFKLIVFGEDPNNPFTVALKSAGIYGWYVGGTVTFIVCGLAYAWRVSVRATRAEERLRWLQLQLAKARAADYERARNQAKGEQR